MSVQNANDSDVRDVYPVNTAITQDRDWFMVWDKQQPVGVNQIDAELACTVVDELVEPKRLPRRDLRQVVGGLEHQEPLLDQLRHPRTVCRLEFASSIHDALKFPLFEGDDHEFEVTCHVTP